MKVDLEYLLRKKPNFFKLTQSEQIKYLAYVYLQSNNHSDFNTACIKKIYSDTDLVVPSHLYREIDKLLKGKIPVLIKKSSNFVFHPLQRKNIEQEFSNCITVSEGKSNKFRKRKANVMMFNKYQLHPQIKKVAYNQFQDGYFKEAIQNAFVEVINQVKVKSGNPTKMVNGRNIDLDGDDLMNRVFGCDGTNTPIIKFNNLSNSLKRTEQRGLMNLYKGIVGVRDLKAHLNFIQNDPHKTIEYLSLASLLMRLLDEHSASIP
jgi:uncharacterized protein (TIGR02391 family)